MLDSAGSTLVEWGRQQQQQHVVEGPAVCVGGEEVLQALNLMKTGEAPGPLEVSLVLIVASVGVEFK